MLIKKGLLLDPDTGEAIDARYITEEEYQRNQKVKKAQQDYILKNQYINKQYKKYGEFVWLLYNINYALNWGIPPEALTKIIILSTFMGYDNCLRYQKNKAMTKEEMMKVLGLRKTAFNRFYNLSIDAGIIIFDNESGTYSLNITKFRKGSLGEEKIDKNKMRIYSKAVKSLYLQASTREHRFLSYIFQVIPYVNINYNILCHNPTEVYLDKIKPMTMKELCNKIRYTENDDRKLKSKMKKITVDGEAVFSFVENNNGIYCYINPNVYYGGKKWDDVKILGKFSSNEESVA